MASMLNNWVVLIKKYEKNGRQMKSFQSSKHFGDELYMFIFIGEIGLLASCYVRMTWLHWSLKLHARLWTNLNLILTHNTQV